MPIQFPSYDRISFDEANPWMVGAERGQKFMQSAQQFPVELQYKILQNQIAAAQAKYAEPMAKSGLTTAQQHNEFDPKIWQSEIGLRGAQAGNLGAETRKTNFMVNNPQYLNPEGMVMSRIMEQEKRNQGGMQNQGQGGGMQMPQGGQQQPQSPGQQIYPVNGQGQAPMFNVPNSAAGQQIQTPGAQAFQGASSQSPISQLTQAQAPQQAQYSPGQYNPTALAYNPPTLPSPTGNPQMDNLAFKKYGQSPLIQAQMDLAKGLAEKYQTQNIERNKEFSNQSVFANESTINAHKFLDALDQSSMLERGYIGGKTPAMSNAAQMMEASSNSIAATNAQAFQNGKAVHSADIELAQMSKSNRKQNIDTSFDLAQGTIARNDRMKERQQYYAHGTELGLKSDVLDTMWNKYETDRPYFNTDTHMPNDAYKGTWKDYLSPEAINAVTQGKEFDFPNQKKLNEFNWTKKDLTGIKKWAKEIGEDPKDFDKMHLYKLAKSEGKSLAELKAELREMGAPI